MVANWHCQNPRNRSEAGFSVYRVLSIPLPRYWLQTPTIYVLIATTPLPYTQTFLQQTMPAREEGDGEVVLSCLCSALPKSVTFNYRTDILVCVCVCVYVCGVWQGGGSVCEGVMMMMCVCVCVCVCVVYGRVVVVCVKGWWSVCVCVFACVRECVCVCVYVCVRECVSE